MKIIVTIPTNNNINIDKKIFVECGECHKIYPVSVERYRIKKTGEHFICSKDCIKRFSSKDMLNNWLTGRYKKRKIEVTCKECGKLYSVPFYDYNRKKKLNQAFLCSEFCLKMFRVKIGRINWSNMGYKRTELPEEDINYIIEHVPFETSKQIASKFNIPIYFVDNLVRRLKLKKTKEHLIKIKSMAGKIGGKIGGLALISKRKEEGTFESFTKLGGKESIKNFRNTGKFGEWQKKGNVASYNVRKTGSPYIFEGERFLSKEEMGWYKFYRTLGLNKTEINHDFKIDNRHIDFFPLNKFFHEHHPFMKVYDGDRTPEKYFKERREILDANGYKEYPVVHTLSINEKNKIKRLVRFYEQ